MDTKCNNCNESWEIYGLLHDEGLLKEIKNKQYIRDGKLTDKYEDKMLSDTIIYFGLDNEFCADMYVSLNEVEHILLLKCACCKTKPKCPYCEEIFEIKQYDDLDNSYLCKCNKKVFLIDTKYEPKKCSMCFDNSIEDNEELCYCCKFRKL